MPGGWIGYNEVTAAQSGITTVTDLTGLSAAVTVNATRRIRITGQAMADRTVADGVIIGLIQEGATILGTWCRAIPAGAADQHLYSGSVVLTPTSGAHTYKLTLQRNSGTGTVRIFADATIPAFILVEDIGPAT